MDVISKKLLQNPVKNASDPAFEFYDKLTTTRYNVHIIQIFDGYMGAVIDAQPYTPENYGSEFRSTSILSTLFFYHEYHNYTMGIITYILDNPLHTL